MVIGIDVAKGKHDAYIYDTQTEEGKWINIPNSRKGFEKLLAKLQPGDEIVCESTGTYHQLLCHFLAQHGYEITVLHPFQARNFARMLYHAKSDRLDAKALALMMANFPKLLKRVQMPDEQKQAIRRLTRQRDALKKQCADVQRRLRQQLNQQMPEIERYFKQMTSPVLLSLLESHPTRQAILSDPTHVEQLLGWQKEKCQQFFREFSESIGLADEYGTFATTTRCMVRQIQFLMEQIKGIEQQVEALMQSCAGSLLSMKGMGCMTAAILIAEVGDITRFHTKKQSVSYVGLDPVVHQSGQSQRNLHISKKGSRLLRQTFYMLAVRLLRYDPRFRSYYDRLIARGKHPKVALVAAARKAAEIVFHLLKTGEDYQPLSS